MHQFDHLDGDDLYIIQIDRLSLVDLACGPAAQHAADLPLYFISQDLGSGSWHCFRREKVVLSALELLREEFFNLLSSPVTQVELLVDFLDVGVFEGRLAVSDISVGV